MPLPPFLRWLSSAQSQSPPLQQQQIQEQVDTTAFSASPTQEDQYWGRLASGGEEDYYWRRLSDNLFEKDVIPSTYLEIHNACYEAYNANPLAFAIIEITTSFVLGKGVTVAASDPTVQRVLMDFWNDPDNHMFGGVYSMYQSLSTASLFLSKSITSATNICSLRVSFIRVLNIFIFQIRFYEICGTPE